MKKIFMFTLLTISLVFFACNNPIISDDSEKITIYYFWEKGCPNCEIQEEFLKNLENKYDDIEIKSYEVSNQENEELLILLLEAYNERKSGVPTTFIGDELIIGFGDAETTGNLIEDIIKKCQINKCKNPADILLESKKEES
ncbi:hypothetical protein KO361_01470 [Candidatus Woesearchaeota archaeon]|nr:hypothetical protein [Candidatus Woesearchaeota archaeon]